MYILPSERQAAQAYYSAGKRYRRAARRYTRVSAEPSNYQTDAGYRRLRRAFIGMRRAEMSAHRALSAFISACRDLQRAADVYRAIEAEMEAVPAIQVPSVPSRVPVQTGGK